MPVAVCKLAGRRACQAHKPIRPPTLEFQPLALEAAVRVNARVASVAGQQRGQQRVHMHHPGLSTMKRNFRIQKCFASLYGRSGVQCPFQGQK
ncbi:hypothetical protein DUNSADRAFT_8883 [Dunaliella salina]|uniref:Encoded protein n=1 Tax=Dunaliella salina TaxID=3046 RepID=A0ABQ7GIK7_DUNSA|nr:hypothetical protein DUNSADRAFT_8883 [Dunaliella salina]|eukprot:KAF5834455.1 hypothetical protein DUNSADRAFT_8883 [Dunaliella salina]